MKEEILYRYIVANTAGTFLVRCKSMKEVREFVYKHIAQCQDAFKLLTGRFPTNNDYQVGDIYDIPTYQL